MPTPWTHDDTVDAVDIDLASTPIAYPIRTVDLHGAHVILDIDAVGTVVSIEILGPLWHPVKPLTRMPLASLHLEKYLLKEANEV
jgi:hypothetical protein